MEWCAGSGGIFVMIELLEESWGGGGGYVWLVGLKPSPFVDRDREFVDRNRDSLEL
jgi:hypothetical protein